MMLSARKFLIVMAIAALPAGQPRGQDNYVSVIDNVKCRLDNASILAAEYNWKVVPARLESVDGLYCNTGGKPEKRVDFVVIGGSSRPSDTLLAIFFTSKAFGNIRIIYGDFRFTDSGVQGQVKDVQVPASYVNSFVQFLEQ